MSGEGLAELSVDQLLETAERVKRVFWQFVVVLGLKMGAGMAFLGAYNPADPASARPYAVVNLALFGCLIISYVLLAVTLTRVATRLGRNPQKIIGWFIALPLIFFFMSQLKGPGPELGGFGGAIGFLLASAIYASPAAIWLSIKRDLDRRLEESSRLSVALR